MTRLEKLEAVAEAARSALHDAPGAHERLSAALDALDADAEAGETVTLAVWRNDKGGWYSWVEPNSSADLPSDEYTRLGTVTLPLDRERGA